MLKTLDILPITWYNIYIEVYMKYKSVAEMAKKWEISERTMRNYCSKGLIEGAFITGKTWNIPENAQKPNIRKRLKNKFLDILIEQKNMNLKGGIYHKTQIMLAYNSNHIEGSKLTEQQTRFIFETNTIGASEPVNVDDVVETINHFKCFDYLLDNATKPLSEKFIKDLHRILKTSTSDSRKSWFRVGEYKKLPNEVGEEETTQPEEVATKMKELISKYNALQKKKLKDIVGFHYAFECIHPFQDGNGRVGRLIMFKECLANNIVPFIIPDNLKFYYYRGLKEYLNESGYLIGTCLTAQDQYKKYLDYFKIEY